MASMDKARKNPKGQLLDQIEKSTAGMLGVQGTGSHMQPMAPMLDRGAGAIWFFTKRGTHLVSEVGSGATAHFCIIARDQDYHACISGPIRQSHSREMIDRYWNPVVAAWYEGGKDDPELVLLELSPRNADVWASTGSAIAFGWEIARANLTGDEPDVGYHTNIVF